jgi:hypothetical protein
MSSLQRLVITSTGTKADFQSNCNLAPGQLPALNNFIDYLGGIAGGSIQGASLAFNVGALKASGTITVATGGSANNETMTICGVTFTAKTSGATGNQFNISAVAATQAANMVTAINAATSLAGIVTATNLLGVVTLSAVVPGTIGNGLVMANVNLANTTVVSFASGTDGTAYSITATA